MNKNIPLLELKDISKQFPGVLANDQVNLKVYPGEVHGLLGENGAGKTTLMKILYGLYQPTGGEIFYKGQRVFLSNPKVALKLGIGMVHQHFKLVPTLTVAENIILGMKESPNPFISLKDAKKAILELGEKYGLQVDPGALVWTLSTGEQQRVEILKALYRNAELLILDEPTAMLTPLVAKALFETLEQLVEAGLTIIFITHKLKEIISVTDNVTVLRRGKVVDSRVTQQTTTEELARLMVGREVLFQVAKEPQKPGNPIIKVTDVEADNDKGLPALRGASLKIHSGEIVGLAGVSGNGQRELAEVLTGLRHATKGRIELHGENVTNFSVKALLKRKVAHIPEDRMGQALALPLTIAENAVLHSYRSPEFNNGPILDYPAINEHTEQLVKDFDVRTPGIDVPARQLSGGNLQKVILARELYQKPQLIVANQPTRGVDVGSCEYIRKKLIEARDRGAAVLLISEDLDEVLDVADRIMVIYEGQLTQAPKNADHQTLGLMMAGEEVKHGEPT